MNMKLYFLQRKMEMMKKTMMNLPIMNKGQGFRILIYETKCNGIEITCKIDFV